MENLIPNIQAILLVLKNLQIQQLKQLIISPKFRISKRMHQMFRVLKVK